MVLFALKIVFPGNVFLNRGNHEDIDICRAYGFSDEVIDKYATAEDSNAGEALFNNICKAFVLLPLCALIEETAFVVHGGLFRDPEVVNTRMFSNCSCSCVFLSHLQISHPCLHCSL